ncbi:hypothetical protein BCR41DRAFT_355986 [Lobosporangium transversale]|uniref:GET complex, subunit GET2 n=1 Tax=Lobosporangium transversale TaxID=64571 RepID=A0A1Y2GJQ8_9FUNG|nr:hypothetical protein BCR41DRAFT_355986 [Lobosporangium transversale]ORZ12971.1 hypothetical protein BCR41DRAFT_355986 [Lobosporangium transversale]|eukprot:XP_021880320.1 hypothetical protein BCR41DRAFT_355986 [Lobosporangium transversale]
MTDQAEILRKRREARQKKILASGESRLSKITGTAGTSAQVAPSPAVLQAREEMLRREQEDERLKALRAAGVNVDSNGNVEGSLQRSIDGEQEEELAMPNSSSLRTGTQRMSRQPSSSSTTTTTQTNATTTTTTTEKASDAEAFNSSAAGRTATPPNIPDYDADPDDSIGAPPAYIPSNPFLNSPFASAQHQALTPGFTVITPQVDHSARWWKLLHFVLSVLLGFGIVYREYSRNGDLSRFEALAVEKPLPYGAYQVDPIPVFWYFITMELILQSTRMVLHGVTASPSSTLGTIAGFLPPPFSDMIRVFMRYRLIWTSMVNDLSVVVFIVGLTITFTYMFS